MSDNSQSISAIGVLREPQFLQKASQRLKVIFRTVKVNALITLATIEAPVAGEPGKVFGTGP